MEKNEEMQRQIWDVTIKSNIYPLNCKCTGDQIEGGNPGHCPDHMTITHFDHIMMTAGLVLHGAVSAVGMD